MDKLMRKFLFLLFLTVSIYSYAQGDIVEKVIRLRQLITDVKTHDALDLINQIENECSKSDNDTLKAVFLELKGQALLDNEKYEESIPVCKEAISLFEHSNLRQYEYLDAWFIIATAYHRLKDYKNAESYYRKGLLRSVAAKVDKVRQYRSSLYLNLGNLYKEQGDTLLAKECYKRIEESSERELIDIDNWNNVEWENAFLDKITNLVDAKQYEEAANMWASFAREIKDKKGRKYKWYIVAVYSRGILLSRYLDKTNDAIPLFQELVNLSDSLAESDENICGAYCNLALCYSMKGLYPNVDETIKQALPYLKKANNGTYSPHTIYRLAGNGAYWKQDYPNAIRYYEQYLSTSNKRESGSNYEEIVNQLSVSYILSGQPAKALSLLNGFLKTDESRLKKEDSPVLANIYHNLGRAYMLNGKIKDALAYLNKSKDLQLKLYGEVSERTTQYIQECSKK
jgi:tetratricopeptide (TPR) repeat protein